MSKSLLTIHREILKKEYDKSPLGIVEKKLKEFYGKNKILPKHILKEISAIREENEKAQMKYIEDSQREDREAVDRMLLESMEKELSIINNYKNTAINDG